MSGRTRLMRIATLFMCVAGAVLAGAFVAAASAQDGRVTISAKEVADARAELEKLGPAPKAFVLISKIIRPSVVAIVTEHREKMEQMPDLFGDDWPFDVPNPFQRRNRRPNQPAPEQKFYGMGSGVIVDKAGHVLTNNHVVSGAVSIKVRLADDTQVDAELVGTDENTDLAVIKLKDCPADKIIPVKLGDSEKLEVGEWVLAVGAPFGLTKSVSAGIVSAIGRTQVMPRDARERERKIFYENFIQTDAAINRGNSGGPLVNYAGEVIGVNAAIETGTGDYAGVGFAIPSNLVKPVMEQLISKGKVTRGYLGVQIGEMTDEKMKELKLAKREGIVVEQVYPNTPASKAGLEAKDVITTVNGKPAQSVTQLQGLIAATEPGAKIRLDLLRQGKPKTVDVVVEELPGELPTAQAALPDEELGITVQTLTADLATQVQAYDGEKGVLVMSVTPGGPADKAGLKVKDLIKEVANKPVASAADYERARKGIALDKGVLLLVKTGDMARLVLVK